METHRQAGTQPGQIVVLNGPPRSGKSSIAKAMARTMDGPWLNVGVDLAMRATPPRYLPGIGLRPGGERPDVEPYVVAAYGALYDSIAAHSRHGLNVVSDVGIHDSYSRPLGILQACANRLAGLPTLFVGVHCRLDDVLARRAMSEGYVADDAEPAQRWQDAVHLPGIYDLELDTSTTTADECAELIAARLRAGPPGHALTRLKR